jgi:hypothetical protein
MNILTQDQLNNLTTPRLLALYKKHRKTKHSIIDHSFEGEPYLKEEVEILEYMDRVKSILDERENV